MRGGRGVVGEGLREGVCVRVAVVVCVEGAGKGRRGIDIGLVCMCMLGEPSPAAHDDLQCLSPRGVHRLQDLRLFVRSIGRSRQVVQRHLSFLHPKIEESPWA